MRTWRIAASFRCSVLFCTGNVSMAWLFSRPSRPTIPAFEELSAHEYARVSQCGGELALLPPRAPTPAANWLQRCWQYCKRGVHTS